MKVTDEMIEAAKQAIYACRPDCYRKKKWLTTVDPAFEIIEEAIPYEEASETNLDMCEKEAKAALEAALQTKLTVQDKLLEAMAGGYKQLLEKAHLCFTIEDYLKLERILAQYQSYKGRE